MAYLDLDHPENSRLLTIPAGPHGSLGVPLLSPGDGHYERILAWIRGVAEYQTELSSETGAPDGDVESIPLTALGTPSSEPSRTTAVAGVVGPTITRLPATDSLPQAAVSAREPPAPRDPFDPEVFNRELPDGP